MSDVDPAMTSNAARVAALIEATRSNVTSVAASATEPAVDVALQTPDGAVTVRIAARRAGAPALAVTRSFAVSYRFAGRLPQATLAHVLAFAKRLSAVDPGSVELAQPTPRPDARRRLRVEGGAPRGRDHGGSWSRDVFDRNVQALRARGRQFDRAVLVVTQACELACTFCPAKDKAHEVHARGESAAQLQELTHQLEVARSLGAQGVEVSGNDVLRFSRVHELLRAAHDLGFGRILAQSPGLELADADFARAIAEGPLTHLALPIYGDRAETHDAVTGRPGSFERLARAIDRVLSLGRPTLELSTLALRSTLERLDELIEHVRVRFGLHVTVRLLRPNRVGEREHLADGAPFTEVAPVARRHPEHFGFDMPLCILPPERRQAVVEADPATSPRGMLHLWDLGIAPGSEDERVKIDRERLFVEACDGCGARHQCRGVLRAHVTHLGVDGLQPIDAVTPSSLAR